MKIQDIVKMDNVASELDQSVLDAIGSRVVEEYEIDKKSMSDWIARNDLAMKLIDQKAEHKTDPWPNSANTKLPLVLNAAMKISAEEYAEILRGDKLVSTVVFGEQTPGKLSRSQRVAKRMNFQYAYELDEWEEDHDKLIFAKNIMGTVHKKYVWCRATKKIECNLRRNGVVINDNTEHLSDAPRITDEIDKYIWECESKFRSKEWKRVELTDSKKDESADSDKIQRFLEQVRREDLDEDGYPEPYVVTVHESSKQVVSIVPNFTPESIKENEGEIVEIDMSRTRVRYVKYEMIPSLEGGYWSWGFGILLGPLNDNCNALINQLIDAGTLANKGGGFVSNQVRMKHGDMKWKVGEWKPVNAPGVSMRDAFFPIPVRDPSSTLFNLLGLLMGVLRELSSVTEVMSGEQPHANMAQGTVMNLIEQGKKVFNSVYKRHWRSLKKEFLALFDLNFLYEDPKAYMRFTDMTVEKLQEMVPDLKAASPSEVALGFVQGDFERVELDVLPNANPEFSSRMERMSRAQAMTQFLGHPKIDDGQILRDYAEAVTDDIEIAKRYVPEEPNKTPTQIMQEMEMMKKQVLDSAEVRIKESEEKIAALQVQQAELALEVKKIESPEKARSSEMKADAADFNAQISAAKLDELLKKNDLLDKELEAAELEIQAVKKELNSAET